MVDDWVLGACGLNCGVCDIYLAGKGDVAKQMENVRWFKEKFGIDLKPDQIRCDGCRGSLEHHWSNECKMMLCAKDKGVEYCFECNDFVCDKLVAFANDGMEHHKRTVDNLKSMKEIGVDSWIEKQRSRGPPVFCP